MKVRDVMKTEIVSISEAGSYKEAAHLMYKNRFSGLPVLDSTGALVGIVSEKDLFRAIYPCYSDFYANPEIYTKHEEREDEIHSIHHSPIKDHMSQNVLTIEPDAPILKAGGLMLAKHIHRLPVVENGKMVGIVTRKEIFGAILEKGLSIQDRIEIQHQRRELDKPSSLSGMEQSNSSEDSAKYSRH